MRAVVDRFARRARSDAGSGRAHSSIGSGRWRAGYPPGIGPVEVASTADLRAGCRRVPETKPGPGGRRSGSATFRRATRWRCGLLVHSSPATTPGCGRDRSPTDSLVGPMSVLIVEDDERICRGVRGQLRDRGSHGDRGGHGSCGAGDRGAGVIRVVVVSSVLPTGPAGCVDRVRGSSSDAHTIVLSDSSTDADRVEALRRGANDYLIKPILFREFTARVLAVRRPRNPDLDACLRVGPLAIDLVARSVVAGDQFRWSSPRRSSTCSPIWRHVPGTSSAATSCSRRYGRYRLTARMAKPSRHTSSVCGPRSRTTLVALLCCARCGPPATSWTVGTTRATTSTPNASVGVFDPGRGSCRVRRPDCHRDDGMLGGRRPSLVR